MLILRKIGFRWKRDNQFIPTKRAKELKKQGVEVKKVAALQACFFPDYQFQSLYDKHVRKISRDLQMTVVVKKQETEPTLEEFRGLVMKAIQGKWDMVREGFYKAEIPKPYYARGWEQGKGWITPVMEGVFRIDAYKEIKANELPKAERELFEKVKQEKEELLPRPFFIEHITVAV